MIKFVKNQIFSNLAFATCIAITLAICISVLGVNRSVSAITCPDGSYLPNAQADQCPYGDGAPPIDDGKDIEFSIDCEPRTGTPLDRTNCGIINIVVIAINFMSALAGIVFVASIMISGFQYMTARDNAGQIQKAKSRIVMTLVAVAIFIFMYALLNFLVPGGVIPQ